MNIKITVKELKAKDSIKSYIEKKCERLVKYFGEDFDVNATIKQEGKDQVAEMHVNTSNGIFRAVTGSKDLYASIDKNIDIVEGQIRKMKTKKDKQNMTDSIRLKESNFSLDNGEEVENEIVKTLFYDVKPVSPEDAKLILQEEPQNKFLAFVNIETGKVNVMYKLKDGKNFGLVEPEV